MKWLDKAIASVAPRYAIKRMQVRQQINNFYEAATVNRLHKQKLNSSDPDAVTKPALESLRDQARHFEQNYDIGRGVLNVLVANTVGDGIKPIAAAKDATGELSTEFNNALMNLWDDWIKDPEVTGDFDYYSAQRMLARSLFRDGEVLTQFISGNVRSLKHNTIVPFSIEMIEADYVPNDLEDEKKGVAQGIQKNTWGRTSGYYVYKNNPDSSYITDIKDTKRIPAKNMVHLKMMDRIRQTRGVSIFASVLNRFDDLKEIDENERVATRVAAAMAGYIKKGSPDMYVAPASGEDEREMEFSPGMIFNMGVGEEIGTIDTTRPNNELIPFRDAQLRGAAAGSQTSYSSISKNYDGTYSAQRQELVEQYAVYGILWGYIKGRLAQPVWERFVDAALLSGELDEFKDGVDLTTVYDCTHTRPPLTWIDPKKEMDAITAELEANLVSRSDVITRRGGNPTEVFKKIAEEKKLFEELGIEVVPVEPDPNMEGEDPPDDDAVAVGDIVKTIDNVYLIRTEEGYEPVKIE